MPGPCELLEKVSRAQREDIALQNHPLTNADLDLRLKYLSALSLVLCIDDIIHWRETQYLQMMMYAFRIPRESLDAILIQGQAWDQSMIKDTIHFLHKQNLEATFFMDACLSAVYDGKLHINEKKLLTKLSTWLSVGKSIYNKASIIMAVPTQTNPIGFFHKHKAEFDGRYKTIQENGCKHVRSVFAIICHDLSRFVNSNTAITRSKQ